MSGHVYPQSLPISAPASNAVNQLNAAVLQRAERARCRSAAIAGPDHYVGRHLVRVCGPLIIFAGRPVQLVTVDTLAMKNRSSVTAVQQLFADTAPALLANFLHKQRSFAEDSRVCLEKSSNYADLARPGSHRARRRRICARSHLPGPGGTIPEMVQHLAGIGNNEDAILLAFSIVSRIYGSRISVA